MEENQQVIVEEGTLTLEEIIKNFKSDIDFDADTLDPKQLDPSYVTRMHTALYEMIYQYFRDKNYKRGMAKALKAKERLLGLRNAGVRNQSIAAQNGRIKDNEVMFDWSRLTDEELKRRDNILEKLGVKMDAEGTLQLI